MDAMPASFDSIAIGFDRYGLIATAPHVADDFADVRRQRDVAMRNLR
jgi:hypothetical protein